MNAAAKNPPAEIRVLRSVPELEEIRSSWETWPGNDDSDMNLYRTYLESSQEVENPHVIVVYRHACPDGMWIGRTELVKLDFRVGYIHLRPKARVIYFVYGGLRGNISRGSSELLIREVCRSLARGEADCAYLNYLNKDCEICGLAGSFPSLLCRDYAATEQEHFSAKLGSTPEEFYSTLSPKVRKNQRWQARKFAQAFPEGITIRCFRCEGEIDPMVHDVEIIAKKSYQRGLGVGFVASPGMREYLRAKARKGSLRGNVLYVGERPCAFWIGSLNFTTFASEYLGFDPDFAAYSPGMYLILRVIEGFYCCAEEPVTEVDFATGSAQYKQVLGNSNWNEAAKYIFAPSLRGVQLGLLRLMTGFLDRNAKRLLMHTGLLARVKKRWRSRARTRVEVNTSIGTTHSDGVVGIP